MWTKFKTWYKGMSPKGKGAFWISMALLVLIGNLLPDEEETTAETTGAESVVTATTAPDSGSSCNRVSTVEYCTTKEAAVAAGRVFAADSDMGPTGFCVRPNGEYEAADGRWNYYLSIDGKCSKPSHEYHAVEASSPSAPAPVVASDEKPNGLTCDDMLYLIRNGEENYREATTGLIHREGKAQRALAQVQRNQADYDRYC